MVPLLFHKLCKPFKTFLLYPPYTSYANSLVWLTSIIVSFDTVPHLSNHSLTSCHQSEPVLTILILISSVLFHHHKVTTISSSVLIDIPDGQRQFLFLILLLKLLLVLLLPIGVLSTVKTDCSTQFEYSPLTALKYLLRTKRIHTTAYHPCANGMVERFHRQFIACFNSSSDSSEWTDLLLLFPLSIRCSLKQDLLCTPAQLVYGSTLRLPSQFFTPSSVDKQLDPAIYADRLSSYMQQL